MLKNILSQIVPMKIRLGLGLGLVLGFVRARVILMVRVRVVVRARVSVLFSLLSLETLLTVCVVSRFVIMRTGQLIAMGKDVNLARS